MQGQKEVSTVLTVTNKKGEKKQFIKAGNKTLNLATSEPCNTVAPNAARQHGELRKTSYGRRAKFIVLALRNPRLLECAKRKKIDPLIHTGYFHTGEANTLIFIVDGGKTVNSFVMCSKDPLEHGRATWQHDMNVQILADVNVTLQDVVERSVVNSTGFFANDIWWEKHSRNNTEMSNLQTSRVLLLHTLREHSDRRASSVPALPPAVAK